MPPDRRSSGKQKRLHTLLCLICLRVLSSVGSVSVTPFPPSLPPCPLSFHLIPPSPARSTPAPPQLLADLIIRPGLTSGGPLVLGGRRRRLIARQWLPPHRLWEPRVPPTSTHWPRTSTREHREERMFNSLHRQFPITHMTVFLPVYSKTNLKIMHEYSSCCTDSCLSNYLKWHKYSKFIQTCINMFTGCIF